MRCYIELKFKNFHNIWYFLQTFYQIIQYRYSTYIECIVYPVGVLYYIISTIVKVDLPNRIWENRMGSVWNRSCQIKMIIRFPRFDLLLVYNNEIPVLSLWWLTRNVWILQMRKMENDRGYKRFKNTRVSLMSESFIKYFIRIDNTEETGKSWVLCKNIAKCFGSSVWRPKIRIDTMCQKHTNRFSIPVEKTRTVVAGIYHWSTIVKILLY